MKAVAIVCGAILIGSVSYAMLADPPFWVEAQIRKSMQSYAFGPDAIKLSGLKYSEKNRDYVCGSVDGANVMGAYVRQKRFAYSTKYAEFYMIGHALSPEYALKQSGCFN